jgi:hypothetical protein
MKKQNSKIILSLFISSYLFSYSPQSSNYSRSISQEQIKALKPSVEALLIDLTMKVERDGISDFILMPKNKSKKSLENIMIVGGVVVEYATLRGWTVDIKRGPEKGPEKGALFIVIKDTKTLHI